MHSEYSLDEILSLWSLVEARRFKEDSPALTPHTHCQPLLLPQQQQQRTGSQSHLSPPKAVPTRPILSPWFRSRPSLVPHPHSCTQHHHQRPRYVAVAARNISRKVMLNCAQSMFATMFVIALESLALNNAQFHSLPFHRVGKEVIWEEKIILENSVSGRRASR